jgi:hypothetical protein
MMEAMMEPKLWYSNHAHTGA